jgi:hypothetical protein
MMKKRSTAVVLPLGGKLGEPVLRKTKVDHFGSFDRDTSQWHNRVQMKIAVTRIDPYDFGLDKNGANYVPLSPLSFLERAASVYPDHVATIHGDWKITWKQCYDRCRRLASALRKRGIGKGDTVALMTPNVPAMYEAHFAVPMIGAVLNTLNLRLDAEAIGFMLQHGESQGRHYRPRVFVSHGACSADARRAAARHRHR